MKTFSRLLFLFYIFIFSDLAAQTDTVITRIITFDDTEIESQNSKTNRYYRNVIKINPFLYLNGDIPVYYERAFTTKLSGEIGIGITRRDYINSIFDDDSDFSFAGSNNEQKVLTGSSFKMAFRFYPEGYAPEEFYMSLEYGYRNHKNEYEATNSNPMEISRELNELKAIIGWQYESYSWDGLFWEIYLGLGARFIRQDVVRESINYLNFQEIVTQGVQSESKTGLGYYIGMKTGVAF